MTEAHYAGCYVDGKPRVVFFDGHEAHDLIERCALQGLSDPGVPDWLAGTTGQFVLARLMLFDAIGNIEFVNDMDVHFALVLAGGCKRTSWAVPLDTVRAWAVRHEPFRRHLRQMYGRDCPSCG